MVYEIVYVNMKNSAPGVDEKEQLEDFRKKKLYFFSKSIKFSISFYLLFCPMCAEKQYNDNQSGSQSRSIRKQFVRKKSHFNLFELGKECKYIICFFCAAPCQRETETNTPWLRNNLIL